MENRVQTKVEVLLVEDNPADVGLLKEAFKGLKTPMKINVVSDGEEAMEYLHQKGKFQNSALPDLVLLDLCLPKKDGHQVLQEIKGDDQLKWVPVIVLSSSQRESDVSRCLHAHANAYIVKPYEFSANLEMAKAIEQFWFATTVSLSRTFPRRKKGLNGASLGGELIEKTRHREE